MNYYNHPHGIADIILSHIHDIPTVCTSHIPSNSVYIYLLIRRLGYSLPSVTMDGARMTASGG